MAHIFALAFDYYAHSIKRTFMFKYEYFLNLFKPICAMTKSLVDFPKVDCSSSLSQRKLKQEIGSLRAASIYTLAGSCNTIE